jgi:hypothetical protein
MEKLWFIHKNSPDFEREKWTFLAYQRDAMADAKSTRLDRFFFDTRQRQSDLESFLAERKVSNLSKEESDRLYWFNQLPDDHKSVNEVYEIVKWALPLVNELYQKFRFSWRLVESSFNLFYLDGTPAVKTTEGILIVRYSGSHISEIYQYKKCGGDLKIELVEYTEKSYKEICDSSGGQICVVAESSMSFNTQMTSIVFLKEALLSKVCA